MIRPTEETPNVAATAAFKSLILLHFFDSLAPGESTNAYSQKLKTSK